MAKECRCSDARQHALAVESAVFQSMCNAWNAGSEAEAARWMGHADKLEGKFTTDHGGHYSYFTATPEQHGGSEA